MPRISGSTGGKGVQAVAFALHILEHLAQQRAAVGVTELANTFATTKSRMHRHLQTLVHAGFLVQEADTERYRVSTRLIALGRAASENFELSAAARSVLYELRDSLGLSVVLSAPEAEGVRILAMISGKSSVEIGVKPGSVLPHHNSAQGKVALAFGDPYRTEEVLKGPLVRTTPYTIVEPDRLRAELETIRRQGWAVSPNEVLIGLNALATPILDASGACAGVLALVDSVQFIAETPSAEQVDAVLAAGRRVSEKLGYRSSDGSFNRQGRAAGSHLSR